MNNSTQVIYIVGTYLIKEETSESWEKRFFAKQVLDEEVWEELLYWRSEAKGPNNEPATSVDEVKKLLLA